MVQRNKDVQFVDQMHGQRLVASRFTVRTRDESDHLLMYNSFTGAFVTILPEDSDQVIEMLDNGVKDQSHPFVQEFLQRGFLIPEGVNEMMRANLQQKESLYKDRVLNLILMPNEDCNFRCVYCYESFAKNKMDEQTKQGVIEFVRREIYQYDSLEISWFGGEPLTAADIVIQLSIELLKICREQGKGYSASMTTNGYLLDFKLFHLLHKVGVRQYQITFDGMAESHDKHRVLANGNPTFQQIYENLLAIKSSELQDFKVVIRSNVDEEVKRHFDAYMRLIVENFGGDHRFTNHFVPIQNLGGTPDPTVGLCDTKDLIPFMEKGMSEGLDFSWYRNKLKPHGSRCYAAKPSSFVIGSDGRVYKCTVAFDDERNHVGQLYSDGRMELEYDRFALWVANGAAEDDTCQKCYFRPSCQGEACPLERIEYNKTPCPPFKRNIKAYMKLLAKQAEHTVLQIEKT